MRLGERTGRAVVAAATLGSGMAMLDSTVVTVALPRMGEDLGASLAQLQWVTNGYLLSLASLILLGGSLGDRFGRKRIFLIGVVGFAAASLLCGIAPNVEVLILARILQGVGGALLTPGSLAMIQGAFVREDRAKAIGAWSGLGGIASAMGPLLGGLLVDHAHWRWIFLINLPLAAITVLVAVRWVPETRDPRASDRFDVGGAVLAILALGGLTYSLIEWGRPLAPWTALVAVAAAIGFWFVERRVREPMLRLALFTDRTFSAANAMTLVVYAALGALMFFLTLQLQTVVGYDALWAGLATLPITACMLFLAAMGGELSARIGPRIPMSLGPLVMAAGTLLLLGVDAEPGHPHGSLGGYLTGPFPALVLFGLGLALMVAPLTATVLAAAPDEYAGVASGVNNAIARSGTLLAVATLPVAVGLSGDAYTDPSRFDAGFERAMISCAVLLLVGAAISWLTIRNPFAEPAEAGAER